jgi:glycosyltransferase involved in cell wall biosynthesis
MSRPRVLFVTTSYPSAESPAAGVFVLEHARAVAPHADIAVLHLDRRHDVRRIVVRRDAEGDFPTWRAAYPYRPTALSMAAHVAAGLSGYRAVRRSGFDPDLLHAHFFLSALPASLVPRPLVATEQWTIFLPEDPATLSRPVRLGARAALHRACTIMPVSESLAAAMRAAGVSGRFRVVPNAVDTDLFTPGPGGGGTRVVTAGLLHRQKGVDVLLRAFAQVRSTLPGVTLDVVGDGPERSAYERLSSGLGLDDAVVFHGLLPKTELASILAASDVFVLASRFETFGAVLAEAQAAGLPVVATRVGGIPEVVDDASRLVEADDVGGLSREIERALAELRSLDRQAVARRARERYSIETVGREIARVYADCLDARDGA